MPIDWINDDMTFKPGFEQNLPAEVREIAKDAKDLPGVFKRIADTQRDFHSRIKIPDTPEGKREVLTKHFKDVLDADAAKAKKDQEEAAATEKSKADEAAAKTRKENLEAAQANTKKLLGGQDGKDYDKNLELCRRVVRGEHCPELVKGLIAKAAGVEPDKLTDDQIKAAIGSDPVIAQTLHKIATLSQDGRMEHGDGHVNSNEEREPGYPHHPEFYANHPDTDPEKVWFIKRGAKFEGTRYVGGFAAAVR